MSILGLGDSMRAKFAMPEIGIRKRKGLKAPGVIDPVLVHALNYVHTHFGNIDGWGNAARPDIMAGNIGVSLSGQRWRQVVLDIDGAGKDCFVERKIVQF